MKRCPTCNRVETDEALKFCRVDGATLVSDSSSIDQEAGTVKLGSGSVAGETATGILPQTTDANINRATAPTIVLPPQSVSSTTSEFRITTKTRLNPKALAIIGIAIVAVVTAVVFISYRSKSRSAAIESIAVMPFVNQSGNADLEYLSDGMTETLIRSLSQLPGLNVKARSSVFRYKGKETDAKTIGKELGVQAVLNGRVIQRGDQLILNLELVNPETENVIWTDEYDRKSSDIVSLQNEIARDVSKKLKLKLSGTDQQKLAKNYTLDPEAYRLYLQGRFYWNKRTPSEVQKAIPQAIEKAPNFALGYVGLADSDEDRDRPTKKEYIRRALEIDDNLAEAHASLGYQYMLDYNWVASERELKRAIELNPNYPQAYAWNGARLMMLGKYDESLAAIQRGLDLDPTSNGINFYKGICLDLAGRRDEAIQQLKKIIQMDPTFPWAHSHLGRLYRLNGDYAASVEERAISVELDGKPEVARLMRESFAKGGWDGFRRYVRQADVNPLWAGVLDEDEKEKWIARLTKQSEEGNFWLFLIKTDTGFDPLRDDPRFQALVKKFDPPN
ncbi:MAG: tetratricopeptide repeat protein [Acidobacteriota bacterium]